MEGCGGCGECGGECEWSEEAQFCLHAAGNILITSVRSTRPEGHIDAKDWVFHLFLNVFILPFGLQ